MIFTIPVLSIDKELIKNKQLLSKALCVTDGLSVKDPLKIEIEDKKINTENFIRHRFGIGNNFQTGKQIDYVLGKWSSVEKNSLERIR